MSDAIVPVAPTKEEFMEEEGLEKVSSEADPGWRHGCYMSVVYSRSSDNTFWQVCFRLSGDGEYHGIEENEFEVYRVVPKEVTTTIYVVWGA